MIELKNISFAYIGSNEKNIKNVSLKVNKGECVLLCGKSGCGKTTVLRLINGLVPHFYGGEYDGEVSVNGMNVFETPLYRLSENIGTVYQNPRSQFFNVDTNSEVAFGIENMAYPKEELFRRYEKAVKDANIAHLMNRSIFELSGGEKQKIAFASVFAMEPDIYLLDEPSSNLDAACTLELRERIRTLKQLGKTIIICEHRLYYLKDIIDRVVYLDDGSVVSDENAETFFSIGEAQRSSMGLRTLDLTKMQMTRQAAPDEALMKVSSISAGYRKKSVIEEVSFEAGAGEVIGLVGHNGAGKSTLAETICGLNKTLGGQISWKGKKLSEKQRQKRCYMVFQDVDYQMFADSVLNECRYGLEGVLQADIEKTLDTLSLLEYKEQHPATLSGGQKQRLAVAVGMVCNKDIIVFDEPTSGLDLISMQRVTSLVHALADMGKVVFIVTHDYEFVSLACSRILQIRDGRLIGDVNVKEDNMDELLSFFMTGKERNETCYA